MPFLRRFVPSLFVVLLLTLLGTPSPAVGPAPRGTPAFNGGVYAVAHRGTFVYVGGAFTVATWNGHTYPRRHLAAFDARTGALLDWAPDTDGTVRALATTAESVYAAGDFHHVGGEPRDSLARLHPTTGAPGSFRHDLYGTAYSLAVGNGRLYLGGSFNRVDRAARANLAAFSLTTGRLDPTWHPAADDAVHAIAATVPSVYVGGAFHHVDDVRGTLRLAALDPATGEPDPSFTPRPPAEVHAIALDGTSLAVATGGVGGRAIAYTPTGVRRWQRVFDGDASAIAVTGGVTYVGGHFDSACLTTATGAHGACADGSQPRVKLAAITASGGLAPWSPQANGVIGVRVLSVNPAAGHLVAGGDFTAVGGVPRYRLAAF